MSEGLDRQPVLHQPRRGVEAARSDAPVGAPKADFEDSFTEERGLVARLRLGDIAAYDVIVARYWRRTARYADGLLGDGDLAADVTQETFGRLWQFRSRLTPSQPVRPWLFRVARNLCFSERRNQRTRLRWVASQGDGSPTPLVRTPSDDVEHAELSHAIEHAIRQLPPKRREVFILFHLQKLSYREIADIMGIRPRSIANHLQAALADLRRSLREFVPSPTE